MVKNLSQTKIQFLNRWPSMGILRRGAKISSPKTIRSTILCGSPLFMALRQQPNSFIDKALIKLRRGEQVYAFQNISRCYLRIGELLDVLVKLIDDKHYGIYHLGSPLKPYYDRIQDLCQETGVPWVGKLLPASGDASPQIQNLNSDKIKKLLKCSFSWSATTGQRGTEVLLLNCQWYYCVSLRLYNSLITLFTSCTFLWSNTRLLSRPLFLKATMHP